MRPLTSDKRIKPARPMAKKTCENQVSELMRFFRWLHRNKEYAWRKPDDFDELRTTVKDIQEERTSIAHSQVKTYLPEQFAILRTMWPHIGTSSGKLCKNACQWDSAMTAGRREIPPWHYRGPCHERHLPCWMSNSPSFGRETGT